MRRSVILALGLGLLPILATAAERPLRLVLVLDRSASMHDSMPALRQAAQEFADGFIEGRDTLGLVVFDASAVVAFPLSKNFKTARPSLVERIALIESASNTGTAEALSLAWAQLREHPAKSTLNVIVLFTDGLPNGITAEFNRPEAGRNAMRPDSGCVHRSSSSEETRLIGVLAQRCGFRVACPSRANVYGPIQPVRRSIQGDGPELVTWLKGPVSESLVVSIASEGCAFRRPGDGLPRDISRIPDEDVYGNSTNGNAYRESVLYLRERTPLDLTAINSPYQIGLASWNAADSAARKIRSDSELRPVIYTIGLAGQPEPLDEVLLQRIANAGSTPEPGENRGHYAKAGFPAELREAFGAVAADVKRAAGR